MILPVLRRRDGVVLAACLALLLGLSLIHI